MRSLTILDRGGAVPEMERWPVQLARLLEERGVEVESPQIIARTGWTTMNLQAALTDADLRPPYDLVTLLIGVNNQYQGRSLDEYREGFADLLGQAIELAGSDRSRVVVLSIPDYAVGEFDDSLFPGVGGGDEAFVKGPITHGTRLHHDGVGSPFVPVG